MSVLHRRVLMEVCDPEHNECKMPYAFLLTVFHLYLSETRITIASNKSVEIIQKNVRENTETQHPVDPPLLQNKPTTNTDLILITLCKTATMNTHLL